MTTGIEPRITTDGGERRTRPVGRVAVAALLGILAIVAIGPSALLLGPGYLAWVSADLARIDIESHRLPNRLVLPGYPVALAGIAAHGLVTDSAPTAALACCAGWFLFFLLLNLGGGMGMGDVKLAGLLGLCLGSIGIVPAIVGIALAFLFGGIGGIVVLARRVGGSGTHVPFGPFLLAGFWVTVALLPALATTPL